MNFKRQLFFAFFLFCGVLSVFGQEEVTVQINGKAYNKLSPALRLDDLMIINLRTSQGVFGKADGSFQVNVLKSDTILIASTGYEYKKITMRDSVLQPVYLVDVPLVKLNVRLHEVVIFAPRELESIYKDIEKLGYNKRDFQIGGADALQSPITFLYQEFSRLEQLKRRNKERINNERRRDLLKELLANYVAGEIINLDNSEFDDFIDFCNVPEPFMKNSTQYDFCIYIKQKFEIYNMMKVRKN